MCFDNTGTTTGYTPALALIVPPGVTFVSASFSGGPVTTRVIQTCTNPAGCTVVDPDSGQSITLQDGETLISVTYPIGSVPTEMPELCLDLQFTLAGPPDTTVGQPLDIGVVPSSPRAPARPTTRRPTRPSSVRARTSPSFPR